MSGDPAKRYHKFVSSFDPIAEALPAMHTTFGRRFVSILDSKEISVGPHDETLNKSVSFHFYGKPSYRPRHNGLYSRKLDSALFCIVLDYSRLPEPDSVLPFDSGGYSDRYACLCDNIQLSEFYLPHGKDMPQRLVRALFGSNKNYWSMDLRPNVDKEISRFDFHSSSLIGLCKASGPINFDQRALSVELHYERPIHLTKSNCLAIVAPDVACEEPELIEFSDALSADLLDYPLELEETSSQQRQIRDRVHEWLEKKPRFGIA